MKQFLRFREIICWLCTPEESGDVGLSGKSTKWLAQKNEPAPGWIKLIFWFGFAFIATMFVVNLH